MTPYERRQRILELLDPESVSSIPKLASALNASPSTIRSDLVFLEEMGQVRRVHGGALRIGSRHDWTSLITPEVHTENRTKKRFVAQRAASLVQDGDAIILSAGSTALELADFLLEHNDLTVFTNGLDVALKLAQEPRFRVYVTGGLLNAGGVTLVSNFGGNNLAGVKVGKAFISCSGFSPILGAMCDDLLEAELKRSMVKAADKVFILCDSSKFEQSGLTSYADCSDVYQVITDDGASNGILDALLQAGVTVTMCGDRVVTLKAGSDTSRRYRIGFANQTEDDVYAVAVREGLERCSAQYGNVELLIADNQLDAEVAIANARYFIDQAVDLVIEFQSHEKAGNVMMDLYRQAQIPVIAMHIPMPGATFFGVDDYSAGKVGGKAAGKFALEQWDGRVDAVLSLDLPQSGPKPAARMQGQLDGIREYVDVPDDAVYGLDSKNLFAEAYAQVRYILPRIPQCHHNIVIAVNDPSALGAIKAVREAGREEEFIFVGQNADAFGRRELRRSGTRLLGSVAYFPEKQGELVLLTAMDILGGKPVPPAVYINHAWINSANVDQYYPDTGQ